MALGWLVSAVSAVRAVRAGVGEEVDPRALGGGDRGVLLLAAFDPAGLTVPSGGVRGVRGVRGGVRGVHGVRESGSLLLDSFRDGLDMLFDLRGVVESQAPSFCDDGLRSMVALGVALGADPKVESRLWTNLP